MSKANARLRRSVLLCVFGLGGLLWVVSEHYGVPRENLAWMFVYTLGAVVGTILFAALSVALLLGLRKLLRRGGD